MDIPEIQRALARRGFRLDDALLHQCAQCGERAVARYALRGGSLGGRYIDLCVACGRARSFRQSAGHESQSEDVGFDIAWNHVALSVPNIAESIAWYEKMLGFKGVVRGQPNPNARQIVADLRRGDITIELFQVADAAPLPESRKNPSEDFRTHGVKHFGFEVKNLPAVLAELKAKGVKMAFEMRDAPTERFAFISDNAGNAIELIEHKAAR